MQKPVDFLHKESLPISKADICKILPDVSATTAEAVLGQMVRDGKIRKVGIGRGTRYIAGA